MLKWACKKVSCINLYFSSRKEREGGREREMERWRGRKRGRDGEMERERERGREAALQE